jgi:hypothetical protein
MTDFRKEWFDLLEQDEYAGIFSRVKSRVKRGAQYAQKRAGKIKRGLGVRSDVEKMNREIKSLANTALETKKKSDFDAFINRYFTGKSRRMRQLAQILVKNQDSQSFKVQRESKEREEKRREATEERRIFMDNRRRIAREKRAAQLKRVREGLGRGVSRVRTDVSRVKALAARRLAEASRKTAEEFEASEKRASAILQALESKPQSYDEGDIQTLFDNFDAVEDDINITDLDELEQLDSDDFDGFSSLVTDLEFDDLGENIVSDLLWRMISIDKDIFGSLISQFDNVIGQESTRNSYIKVYKRVKQKGYDNRKSVSVQGMDYSDVKSKIGRIGNLDDDFDKDLDLMIDSLEKWRTASDFFKENIMRLDSISSSPAAFYLPLIVFLGTLSPKTIIDMVYDGDSLREPRLNEKLIKVFVSSLTKEGRRDFSSRMDQEYDSEDTWTDEEDAFGDDFESEFADPMTADITDCVPSESMEYECRYHRHDHPHHKHCIKKRQCHPEKTMLQRLRDYLCPLNILNPKRLIKMLYSTICRGIRPQCVRKHISHCVSEKDFNTYYIIASMKRDIKSLSPCMLRHKAELMRHMYKKHMNQ